MEHVQPSAGSSSKDTDKEAYAYATPMPARHEERVCGMKRTTFFIAFLLALLILGGSLAGGLAGGLSARKKNIVMSPTASSAPGSTMSSTGSSMSSPNPSGFSSASSLSVHPSSTVLSASTVNSPTLTASPAPVSTGPGGVLVECPAANNTYISVPGTTQRFFRTCNTDYNGNTGSVDIAHFVVNSFVQCMQTCVAFNSLGNTTTTCTGVSWRWQGLPGTDYNFCYLKSGLGTLIPLVGVEAAALQ